MEESALMAPFFCPRFFCPFKSPAVISIDVNMPFNVHALQRDQNVVKHWIPDARTPPVSQRREKKYPVQKRLARHLAATVGSSSSDATTVDSKPFVGEPHPERWQIRHLQTDPKSQTLFRGFHRSYCQLSSVSSPSISSGVQMIGIGIPISVRMP